MSRPLQTDLFGNDRLTREARETQVDPAAGGVPPAALIQEGPEGPYLPVVCVICGDLTLKESGGYDGPIPEELWAAWDAEAEQRMG